MNSSLLHKHFKTSAARSSLTRFGLAIVLAMIGLLLSMFAAVSLGAKDLTLTTVWTAIVQYNPVLVKTKHVYMIPDQPWLDYSALGAKMALDDAEKQFAK